MSTPQDSPASLPHRAAVRLRAALRAPGLRRVAGAAAAALTPAHRTAAPRTHLLVAPPGHGNIGDQALVEAFLEQVAGPVTVITRRAGDVEVPDDARDRVVVRPLPSLVYGGALGHARDLRTFARLLDDAVSLSVVGADVMDGAYVTGASVARADIARFAARRGVDSRVLGFSWNAAPHPAARAAVLRAERAGVRMLLRDPVSHERAIADGFRDPVLTADIVFTAATVDEALADEVTERLAGRPFAIVNASGLVGDVEPQLAEYLPIVSALRAAGLAVVVLPHVSRPGADDLPVCRRLVAAADDPQVVLVERLETPRRIRGLARRAELTVTGRMHLAIMSLLGGVPAVTVATQGKVEGLMRSLGAEELCQPPGAGLGSRVVPVIGAALPAGSPIRLAVAATLPEVVARAARNLDGLRVPDAAAV
ncbi:polysaccharide pyruvyl transferase family protein [Protaetiibacter mangrovi]|uniref:Polysaccharide pyruvyl transferase family protein n=1 Tax=Protaetiibacter mangrovi TaxID=2970926 RepID=A0ABT1ZBF5_9MICO|nr:polysaccharide pyruvyl transferase family protein [Protaetiibacter mangrovi]MCS0498041.1 polysaccharide pyruvyl transferase family protein [Protaetiibacter mangrovi]